MIDDYGAGGLAAIGVHDVLAALANGQADTVFISNALEQELHEALAPELKELPEDAGARITDAIVTRAYQTRAGGEIHRESGAAGRCGRRGRGAEIPSVIG